MTKALQDAADAMSRANAVGQDLASNYSTTVQMNSAITAKADEISLNVSKTYSTKVEVTEATAGAISAAAKDATNKANSALSSANNNTANLLKSYSTTTEMNSAIKAKADEITLEVGKTYETITNASKKYEEFSASIKVNADAIKSKVSHGNISSEISQEAGQISIKANRFSLESTNLTIADDGTIAAKNVDLTGKITAESGKVGGFDIGTSSLRYLKSHYGESAVGVYIGFEGLSVGYGFRVSNTGDVTIGNGGDINVGGCMNFTSYSSYDAKIQFAGTDAIKFDSGKTTILSQHAILGKLYGYIGFFGDAGNTQKTVSTITSPSSATASTIATKINELINALKAYNLIG